MNSRLSQIIVAAYFGCQVKVHFTRIVECLNEPMLHEYIGIGTIVGVSESGIKCEGDWLNVVGKFHDIFPLSICQLILTPINEITDEHAIELAELCNAVEDDATREERIGKGKIIALFHTEYKKYETCSYNERITIDFLRANHYDCGYMGIISLIQSGIATTIPKKK